MLLLDAPNRCNVADVMAQSTSPTMNVATLRDTETTSSLDHAPSIALTIAYHPHLDRIGQRHILSSTDKPTELSRERPDFGAPGGSSGEPLLDPGISKRAPIYLSTTPDGGICIEVSESGTNLTIGRQSITGKVKLSAEDIAQGVVLALGKRIVLLLHSIPPFDDLLASVDPTIAPEMIGTSAGLRRVLLEVSNVADRNKNVLLRGETGSGKELVANAIHRASQRSKGPMETFNVASVVESLAEAELFGVEEGAYTGAVKRMGHFERATQGTIFLDEIGEISSSIQPKLLRTLDNGEIQPVGAKKARKVDVRVISATDASLENKIANKSFSEALYQRLKGYEIWIPPLRERREDIGLLFVHFLRQELAATHELHRLEVNETDTKPWLSASIVAQVIDYDWPGNVRELKHAVGQMVITSRGRSHLELPTSLTRLWGQLPPRIKPTEMRAEVSTQPATTVANPAPAPASIKPAEIAAEGSKQPAMPVANPAPAPASIKPADISEDQLRGALRASRWDLAATAKRLGISRGAVYTLKERFPWFRVAGDFRVEEIQTCHQECNGQLPTMAEKLEVSEEGLKRRMRDLGLKFER